VALEKSVAALALSALLTLLIPVIFIWGQNQWWRNPLFDFVLIASVSSVLAYVFPIAHHLGAGAGTGNQGQRFAMVYTSNVMGAALGPLVTGYLLLNSFTLQQVFLAWPSCSCALSPSSMAHKSLGLIKMRS